MSSVFTCYLGAGKRGELICIAVELDWGWGLEGDVGNTRCTEALELCTWISLRSFSLSSASQGPVVRQFLWVCQCDWHLGSVWGITGDFLVVSVGTFGDTDSYFCGRFNNFRAWQHWLQLVNMKLNKCILLSGGRRSGSTWWEWVSYLLHRI